MNVKASAAASEIPREEIIEAAKSYNEVSLRIKRNDTRGRWATITASIIMPTIDLLTIDDWLLQHAGGGSYRIETTMPEDPARTVVKPFMVPLEGPQRSFMSPPRNGEPAHPPPVGAAPYHAPSTGPSLDHRYAQQPGVRDFQARTPDQIATQGWEQSRGEMLEERRGRTRERQQAEERDAALRKELTDLHATIAKQSADNDLRSLEMKIEAMNNNRAKPIEWAPILVGLAPMVTALIEAGGNRQNAAATVAAAREGQSTDLVKAMIASSEGKSGGIEQLVALVPVIMPLVQSMMDQKDPSKLADLFASMSDSVMSQASMSAQIYQQLNDGQGAEPPWMPIVTALTESAEKIAQGMMDQGPDAPPRVPGGGTAVPTVVSGPPSGAVEAQPGSSGAAPAGDPKTDSDPAVARMNEVMAKMPEYLQSQEWAVIVYHLLSESDSVLQDAAAEIIRQIVASAAPELQAVVKDPAALGPAFLELLPVSPEYSKKIMEAVFAAGVAGPPERPAVVTPPPAPTANGARGPSGMLVGDEIPGHARRNGPH